MDYTDSNFYEATDPGNTQRTPLILKTSCKTCCFVLIKLSFPKHVQLLLPSNDTSMGADIFTEFHTLCGFSNGQLREKHFLSTAIHVPHLKYLSRSHLGFPRPRIHCESGQPMLGPTDDIQMRKRKTQQPSRSRVSEPLTSQVGHNLNLDRLFQGDGLIVQLLGPPDK